MQTWAKRGLHTALVTGSLLMLGTGIASADEDVNPDKPASPLDGSVSAPGDCHGNVADTPFGSRAVPSVHKDATVRAADLTRAVPAGRVAPVANPTVMQAEQAVAELASPAVDKVRNEAASFTDGVRDQARPPHAKTKPITDRLDKIPGGEGLSNVPSLDRSGTIAAAPIELLATGFGRAPVAVGGATADATNTAVAGDSYARGHAGIPFGTTANTTPADLIDVFSKPVAAIDKATTTAENTTNTTSGRVVDANGDSGFIAGNLVDGPTGAVVQPFGDAVSVVDSTSKAIGYGDSRGEVGGIPKTSGNGLGEPSGLDMTLPIGASDPVYDVPVEVLAKAIAESANTSTPQVCEGEPRISPPVSDGIAPTRVPSFMHGARAMPSSDPVRGVFSGVLTGMPGQHEVTDVPSLVSRGVLAESPATLPAPAARTEVAGPVHGVVDGPLSGLLSGLLDGLLGGLLGGHLDGALLGGRQRALPQVPAAPDLAQVLSTIQPTGVGGLGRGGVESPLAYAPIVGDPADVTAVLPVTSAAPVSAGVPLAHVPGVGEVSPRTEASTLDSTRAALANLFTTHPIG